jgi:hypothetical protein
MYNVFNSFLDVDTWSTHHPSDEERFYKALSEVIRNPKFSADDMAEYMLSHKELDNAGNDDLRVKRIYQLQTAAEHISDYLKVTG